jgi:tetratricopeptide (TPR) repeat protein
MVMRHLIWLVVVSAIALAACSRKHELEFDARVAGLHETALAHPDSVALWVDLGRKCLDLEEDTEYLDFLPMAETALLHALQLDPADVPLLTQMARLRAAEHNYDGALKLAYAGVARDAGASAAWGLMGDAFFEMGDYVAADSCYDTMKKLDTGFEPLLRVARVTALTGEYETAISDIDRAIDNAVAWGVDPRRQAAALVEQGELFYSHGFVVAAGRSAQQALELQPESLPALSLRARVLDIVEPGGRAGELYRQLVRLSPHPRYKSMLARYYKQRGDVARADSLVEVAQREFKALAEHYAMVVNRDHVEFMLEWGIDPAQTVFLAVKETRRRKDIRGYELLAEAYRADGQYDLAWSSIALALRRGVKHPRVLYHAALIARDDGKPDKYETYYNRAIEANPLVEKIYATP